MNVAMYGNFVPFSRIYDNFVPFSRVRGLDIGISARAAQATAFPKPFPISTLHQACCIPLLR